MKKLVSSLALVAFLFSMTVNAQEDPKQQKKKAKTEKTCSAEEKKACAKDKKACCSAKKAEVKS